MTVPHSPFRLETRPAAAPVRVSGRKRAGPADAPPTLAEAKERLAAHRTRVNPWLTPVVVESPEGLPELLGPATYRKP